MIGIASRISALPIGPSRNNFWRACGMSSAFCLFATSGASRNVRSPGRKAAAISWRNFARSLFAGRPRPGTISRRAAFSLLNGSLRMADNQDRKAPVGGRTLAIIVGAILVVFIILVWGPWNVTHV